MNSEDGGQTPQRDQLGPEQDASLGPTPPSGVRSSTEPPSGDRNRRTGLLLAAALAVVVALVAIIALASGGESTPLAGPVTDTTATAEADAGDTGEQIVAPQDVTAAALAALPQSTTFTTVTGAPADPAPTARTSGRIVHPTTTVAVFAAPGSAPIAALPPQQHFAELATDTKVPVIAEQPGWAQVLLPSRPNGSTGWVYLEDPAVTTEHSRYRIAVDREHFALTLFENDAQIGRWTIGVGKAGAVTPAGRTFVLSSILEDHPTFSPVVLPLGAHSDTHTTFGGGPGTVGIHTWPTATVFGQASSDGCVRIPPDALDVISTTVPLGSVVDIT
ncbi:L,D-transpeptidase [Amycolatopsis saalfeldensis]|uniref:L,D-transpeptidase catalytic domain n=1 Tax=Amycolatopsis saalfeldensis TaxID=394193 RepID=A0A1H8YQN8_9PSEU|nr:L,D-transpeptidase [Amycolatopsis saalfeldensis]SEP54500.1 L,D-transpeptidase catalytic domain [Amycolatopsis saalfeldensis]